MKTIIKLLLRLVALIATIISFVLLFYVDPYKIGLLSLLVSNVCLLISEIMSSFDNNSDVAVVMKSSPLLTEKMSQDPDLFARAAERTKTFDQPQHTEEAFDEVLIQFKKDNPTNTHEETLKRVAEISGKLNEGSRSHQIHSLLGRVG